MKDVREERGRRPTMVGTKGATHWCGKRNLGVETHATITDIPFVRLYEMGEYEGRLSFS